jgi:hypothetical protein
LVVVVAVALVVVAVVVVVVAVVKPRARMCDPLIVAKAIRAVAKAMRIGAKAPAIRSVPQKKEGGRQKLAAEQHRKHRADASQMRHAADGEAGGDGFAGEQVLAVLGSITHIAKGTDISRRCGGLIF